MENDLFLAVINPRFDVLPLVRRHFEKRQADQRWGIFDSVRNYGLYFDMQETLEVRPGSGLLALRADVCNAHDEACRRLWKTYFNAANISERRNPKLHLRQLPRRYWHICRKRI
jgi:probable DNA metabolism protein